MSTGYLDKYKQNKDKTWDYEVIDYYDNINELSEQDKKHIKQTLINTLIHDVSVEEYDRIRNNTKSTKQALEVMNEHGATAYFFLPDKLQQNKDVILEYMSRAHNREVENYKASEFATYNKLPNNLFNDYEFLEKAVKKNIYILSDTPNGSKAHEIYKNHRTTEPLKTLEIMKLADELHASLVKKPEQSPTKRMKI